MLSKEIEEIKNNFKEVISYSQNIPDPKVNELFKQWFNAKKEIIYCLLNGKFSYTFPEKVVFHLDESEKNKRLNEFIDSIDSHWDNEELANFIYENQEGFFGNTVLEDYIVPSSKEIIKKGSKIVKAFKFFEKDKIVLDEIQTIASRLIQEDKIEGYLTFSVHPLDFLSSSENNYNWRSCHSLDGEYKAGNLSYMLDQSTIVVYLSSKETSILPNFPNTVPWNSKKWRVLFFLSNDWNMLFSGRQYPFASKNGIKIVLNHFSKLMSGSEDSAFFRDWEDKLIDKVDLNGGELSLTCDYVPVGYRLMPLKDLIQDKIPQGQDSALHYNDLLYSSCYKPIYSYCFNSLYYLKPTGTTTKETHFEIGGTPKCLRCGEEEIKYSNTMQCPKCVAIYGDCEDEERCDCCNRRMSLKDVGYWVDDFYLCPSCYEEYSKTCAVCGERHFTNIMRYDRKTKQYICSFCLKREE